LVSRGMVAITADYRVRSRQHVEVVECVRDAESAIRWVRAHAQTLGVDPDRIVASGGSAGGHLAAAAGVIEGLDEVDEDLKVSSKPNALILFNPVLVRKELSPYDELRSAAPPAIILHGKADTAVPFATVEMFAAKMRELGSRCDVAGFDGQEHGFFNYGRGENEMYRETLRRADEFLTSLEYLKGRPTP